MNKDLATLSDEALMTKYQSGDFDAFKVLYERHSGRLLGYLKSKAPMETANDLLQDTFANLHRHKNKYDSQYPFLPWLFTIARNALYDFMKKAETKVEFHSSSLELNPSLITENNSTALNEGWTFNLHNLPDLQKQAIEYRYLKGWSFEQISLVMKTTPENARQLISRGVKKLRSSFGKVVSK